MELNNDKIDETVLALLYLGIHEENRTWKSFDWETMNRLYQKDFTSTVS